MRSRLSKDSTACFTCFLQSELSSPPSHLGDFLLAFVFISVIPIHHYSPAIVPNVLLAHRQKRQQNYTILVTLNSGNLTFAIQESVDAVTVGG